MNPIISVINNKGGTAKTTTVINTGDALSRLGKRILIIDMDNQCNATDILQGGMEKPFVKSLYDLIDPRGDRSDNENADIESCIYPTVNKKLHFIPNIPDSAILSPRIVLGGESALFLLRERMRNYALNNFDFTFIDCPPNVDVFVISALIASDLVIVPTMAGSKFSLNGLVKTKAFIDDIGDRYNADLKFLKLLITMVDSRTSICKTIVNAIRKTFLEHEVFYQTIPMNTDFQKAEVFNQSIFDYRIGAPGAGAYMNVAEEIIHSIKSKNNVLNP
ncbi:MAG: Chromosome-partitioning ATPase Soj [Smithella sp. PtaU1.Bin162]|nr:MAG: Chromosome-partitioning ATPase Soj [Smithella sp. PtaU1.Bin162]